jgi:condensation domain-containing protein
MEVGSMKKYYSPSPREIQDWHMNYVIKKRHAPNFMTFEVALDADADISCIGAIYATLLKRHEVLRTSFPLVNGQVKRQIHAYDPLIFGLMQGECIQPADSSRSLFARMSPLFKDIKNPPLVRAILFKNGGSGFYFLFCIHHILSDYQSLGIIKDELLDLYKDCTNGQQQPTEDLIPLHEYIERRKEWVSYTHEKSLGYWQTVLSDPVWQMNYYSLYERGFRFGLSSALLKGVSGGRYRYQSHLLRNQAGESYTACIQGELLQELDQFGTVTKFSTFIILLTCYQILALRLTGNRHVLMQIMYSDRISPDTRTMIGNLLATVLLCNEVDEEISVRKFAGQVYRAFFNATGKPVYNTESLEPLQLTTRTFLFLNFISKEMIGEQYYEPHEPIKGRKASAISPLYCEASEFVNCIVLKWEYHIGFFDCPFMHYINHLFLDLLRVMVASPDRAVKHIHVENIAAHHHAGPAY